MGETVVRLIRIESKMGTKRNTLARAVAVIVFTCFTLFATKSHAVFFDLRGLTPNQSFSYSLSAAGINAQVGGSGFLLSSGAATFGADATGVNDDPALLDGGSGFAESFAIQFSQDVFLESILISQFGENDAGTFNIKAGATISLANGLNIVGNVAGGGANFLRWAGVNAPGAGRGFSVDGFTARLLGTVPAQAGDYNNNGVVDAADYVVWRKTQGNSIIPFAGADGDGDGVVNAGDYSFWRQKFGKPPGSGAEISAVPEASTTFLFLTGAVAFFQGQRRHRLMPAGS